MPRAGLNKLRVVEEAEKLADEVGLSRLTLVALAQRLGVRQPSLYKHVVGVVGDVMAGYHLEGDDAIDAIRALRAALHGSVALEASGGFGLPVDIDRSFDRLVAGLEVALAGWSTLSARRGEPTMSMAAHTRPGPPTPDGTVTGAPRRWLRLEAAIVVAGALVAYATTHQWWLIPLALLLPDLLMAGYLRSTRIGALTDNLANATTLPAGLVAVGWWQNRPLVLAVGLVWLAHIGMDRALGCGLEYNDHFQHADLGRWGQP